MKRTFKAKAIATQPSLSQRVARMEAYLEQMSRGFDELVGRYNHLLERQNKLEGIAPDSVAIPAQVGIPVTPEEGASDRASALIDSLYSGDGKPS